MSCVTRHSSHLPMHWITRGSAAKHCRVALESVEASCGKELAVGEAITQLADEPGLKKRTWNGFDGPASACHKTGREEQEDILRLYINKPDLTPIGADQS
uniref:Uncharacterized protein n=1 Tax=Caenorhabditis japonica TaxID=281687 RepID=A0A8R1INX2_CAEJA